MTQTYRPRNDERRNEHERDETRDAGASMNRPNVSGNPRTVTTPRDANPTDAHSPTFSPTRPTASGSPENGPTEDEIRRRAYEIYQGRGGEPGREAEDWTQAERELRTERKATR